MKRLLLAISLIAGAIAAYTSCTEPEQAPEIIKVESVSIDQEDMTLTEGESVTLTTTILPEDAAEKTITWSSSNDDIVMIASNGKAKALSVGSAEISAKAGDKTDFITITVSAKVIPVTGISLTPSSITMKVGETQTITAEVTPQDATDKSVTWVSSNPDVATVENGTVTGLKPGSVTITATTVNGGKTGECAVTVKTNLAPSVTVGADHISAVSAVLQGKANLEDSAPSDLMVGFQYSTSSGILPSNSFTISASDADSQYNYSAVIAELTPSTKYYYRSFIRQNGTDTYGETKEFTTKDISSVLETLDASDIEATTAALNAILDLTDVHFSSLEYGFLWGQNADSQTTNLSGEDISNNSFSAVLFGLSHKTQYWYKAYIKLDSQTFYGVVKTFTTGVVPVGSVSVDKTEYTFHTIGNALTLKATVLPADATDKSVEWSSDKEDVATVDANGRVTAKGNGKATITVTTKDQGKSATCVITVAQWVTGISLDKTSITLCEGQEQTLIPTVNPSSAADKSLNWTSNNTSVATVNAEGKVTAVSKGTATIKAEAKDGSGVFASCSVIVFAEKVDMGIKTSDGKTLYWSTRNLCKSGFVNSPEDYGDYYAWGETEPKENYSWSTYKFGTSSSGPFSKYNTKSSYGNVDNKTVLEPEDDVVHVKLGGKWRMPTDEEWTELRTKCTWTWTTQNGVYGRLVTGPNGNSIFLPAAGLREDASLCDGASGHYLSSSLGSDNRPDLAWSVIFRSGNVTGGSYRFRCSGYSVRPVSE